MNDIQSEIKICPFCNQEFIVTQDKKKFCSVGCAARYNGITNAEKIRKTIQDMYDTDPAYHDRVSKATIQAMQRPEVKKKHRDGVDRRVNDPEARKHASEATLKAYHEGRLKSIFGYDNPTGVEIIRKTKIRMLTDKNPMRSPDKAKNIEKMNEKYTSEKRSIAARKWLSEKDPDYFNSLSERFLKLWKDEEWRKRTTANIITASHKRPSGLEQRIINIVDSCDLPYRYTGDGTFIIGKRCPDFININSLKITFNINGDYWHQGEDIEEIKKEYTDYGWHFSILWEHDIVKMTDEEIASWIKGLEYAKT